MSIRSTLSTGALGLAILAGLCASYYWGQYWMGMGTVDTVYYALVWTGVGLVFAVVGAGFEKLANWGG